MMATSRLKFTKRSVAIVLALLLALLATLALTSYVKGVETRTLAQGEPVEVFVAKDVIPAGTSAEQAIAAGLVVRQPVPRRNVPFGAIGALGDIEGRIASANIGAGEEIIAERFVLPAQAAAQMEIPEGHHAMAIEVGVPEGVAGFVEPGERVGIIARVEVPDPQAPDQLVDPDNPAAGTEEATEVQVRFILMGVEVLGVGSRTGPLTAEEAEVQQGPTSLLATLALTPADAEKLAFAKWEGDLHFTLMPEGAEVVTTPGRTAETIFGE
jgi:pilus assembly protein CpaB